MARKLQWYDYKWHELVALNDRKTFSSEVERQERRHKLEMALSHMMPWNDCDFSRINVRSPHPLECRSADDWSRILEGNLGATVRVCIGRATFWCIPALLQLHSGYFARHPRSVSRFREGTDLTAVGFRAAYDWMRQKEPLDANSQPGKLVELLHTAIQLDISSLEVICNRYLCSSQCREQIAFDIYMRARTYEVLRPQCQLMLQRIGFHFLAMVGDSQYLDLPVEDLVTILQQDNLGVNTEMEVLYSIIRWMAARPIKRRGLLSRLFECIRFTRLPNKLLRRMWHGLMFPDLSNNLNFLTILKDDLEVEERISQAITVVGLRAIYTDHHEFKKMCRDFSLAVDAPREWLYDEDCPYHRPRPRAPYSHVSFSAFFKYVTLRAEKAKEAPRELINLRATLPSSETEKQDGDVDLEQDNYDDLDYISGEMLRLQQDPQETSNPIIPPIMESATEREEDPDDEQPVPLSPEEWNDQVEFEELESVPAQSKIEESRESGQCLLVHPEPVQTEASALAQSPAPATVPTQAVSLVSSPASTSTAVLCGAPMLVSVLLPAPATVSFLLRNRRNHNEDMLGEGLTSRIGIHIPSPTNMVYSPTRSRWLMAIRDCLIGDEVEANREDEDITCRSRYAADLENMCNGQPLAPEVEDGYPEDKKIEVVPFESYLLTTSEIIAQMLARVGEKDDAEVKEAPELAPEENNSKS
ncbi:uncharacterized protein [Drosophila bipectinata]|uniref:uncharacterized protein n=1 Tax=Drosophila bipectinata TaxID=42026 RepID=UPI001C8AB338|nr:uncharacterized protein LOC108133750 [Drosophila bipectinata]